MEVVVLRVLGMRVPDIASALGVSGRAIDSRVRAAKLKLGARSFPHLVWRAWERGVVDPAAVTAHAHRVPVSSASNGRRLRSQYHHRGPVASGDLRFRDLVVLSAYAAGAEGSEVWDHMGVSRHVVRDAAARITAEFGVSDIARCVWEAARSGALNREMVVAAERTIKFKEEVGG